jgi:superkiller protein 3
LIREHEPPLGGNMLRMMWRLARADVNAAETWLRVGVLAASMDKHEPTCQHYERALGLDPQQRVAWVNLGHARLQLGRFMAAEEAYLEALALDPDDGLVHNNLAVIYMSVNQPNRAAASMNRALELGYDVPQALRDAIRQALGDGASL